MFSAMKDVMFTGDENVRILYQNQEDHTLFFVIETLSPCASCPVCNHISHRPHSRYVRRIRDLPISNHDIQFELISRKWFCDQEACAQKVFTERIPWLKPYQRNTNRLEELIEKVAFSTNGLTAEKVCNALHIPVSHDTLLRRVKKKENTPMVSPFRRD